MLSSGDDLPIAGEEPCVQPLELGDVCLDDGICEIPRKAPVMPAPRSPRSRGVHGPNSSVGSWSGAFDSLDRTDRNRSYSLTMAPSPYPLKGTALCREQKAAGWLLRYLVRLYGSISLVAIKPSATLAASASESEPNHLCKSPGRNS